MTAPAARKSLVQLWKQGWNELPEIMGSSMFALFGIGIGIYSVRRYYKEELYNHRYKDLYLVYRPEDPRAARIRSFSDSPQKTSSASAPCGCK